MRCLRSSALVVTVALVAACGKERIERPVDAVEAAPGPALRVAPFVPFAAVTPLAPPDEAPARLPIFDPVAAQKAVAAVRLLGCERQQFSSEGEVSVTFEPSGTVSAVNAELTPLLLAEQSCVVRRLTRVRIPPFTPTSSGATVSRSFRFPVAAEYARGPEPGITSR